MHKDIQQAQFAASEQFCDDISVDVKRAIKEEKVKNGLTIKDAGEARTAVARALPVLKELHAEAGDAMTFA